MEDDLLGSRIENLLGKAKSEVYLCSPFIKEKVLRRLFKKIPKNVPIVVFTRWRPDEVARGVSDLEVFDLAKKRPKTKLRLLDELHAKLYVADKRCLVGSANLTDMALGWRDRSNLEILVPARRSDKPIKSLLTQLKQSARKATLELREYIEDRAADLKDAAHELREFQAEQERLQQDEARRSGRPSTITGFVLDGKEYQCEDAINTLKRIIETLAEDNQQFMGEFDMKTRKPKRRLVARRSLELHRDRKEVEKFKTRLKLDKKWWMLKHRGTVQIREFIETACEVAGIKFGSELTLIEQ